MLCAEGHAIYSFLEDEDDEDDGEEVEGKLSSSGRELKKLLEQVGGQKDDGEEDDENDNDEDRGHDHNEVIPLLFIYNFLVRFPSEL